MLAGKTEFRRLWTHDNNMLLALVCMPTEKTVKESNITKYIMVAVSGL